MSPLLTGLAKLTREELDALMLESDRLKKYERERILNEYEQWARDIAEAADNASWFDPRDELGMRTTVTMVRSIAARLREET